MSLKDRLLNKVRYTFNIDPYEEFMKTLRSFQVNAVSACYSFEDKGRITAPCGCGKTCIQEAWHVGDMVEGDLPGDPGVYVIASHRLILNNQLLNRILDLAIQCGIPVDVLYVGSMSVNLAYYYTKYASIGYTTEVSRHLQSTSKAEIEQFVTRARSSNRSVLIVSTYDSFDLLANIGDINQCSFDEAHNTLEQGFASNIAKVMPHIKKARFFTATPKVRGEDGGMNDVSVYGEVLYDYAPHKALEDSEISCPRIHIIDSIDPNKTTSDFNVHMLVKNLIEAYQKHKELVMAHSFDASMIAPKILVSASSSDEMISIYNNSTFRKFVESENIATAAISSKEGGFFNTDSQNRTNFMIKLSCLADNQCAIIFNVDILTEGFDLPAITGVMPLRNMSSSRLLQLLGRCLRLHKFDRTRLYDGQLTPRDYDNYVKPFGYVIIPRHLTSVDEHAEMIRCIRTIINAYNTPADHMVIQDKYHDQHHDQLESVIPFDPNAGRTFDLIHTIADVINMEMFSEKIANMNQVDKIEYLKAITGELRQ